MSEVRKLLPQVFPEKEVAKAGLLEKQNQQTRAALEAASFVEGFSLLPSFDKSYNITGRITLCTGILTGRDQQYIQLVGSALWVTNPGAAQAIRVSVFLEGNDAPSFRLAYAQFGASADSEATMLPFQYIFKLPRKSTAFALRADVGGSAAIACSNLAYFRFKDGPT